MKGKSQFGEQPPTASRKWFNLAQAIRRGEDAWTSIGLGRIGTEGLQHHEGYCSSSLRGNPSHLLR
jgi:hypothetical protein